MPPLDPADPRGIVGALERNGVDYVVIGGWAAVAYGVDRATFDLDIVVAEGPDNAAALASALSDLEARRDLGGGLSEGLALEEPGSLLVGPLRLVTTAGRLDVLQRVPGVGSYAKLRADARLASFGTGTDFVVCSKSHLESIKEAVAEQDDPARGGRDRADLEALRATPDPDLPKA